MLVKRCAGGMMCSLPWWYFEWVQSVWPSVNFWVFALIDLIKMIFPTHSCCSNGKLMMKCDERKCHISQLEVHKFKIALWKRQNFISSALVISLVMWWSTMVCFVLWYLVGALGSVTNTCFPSSLQAHSGSANAMFLLFFLLELFLDVFWHLGHRFWFLLEFWLALEPLLLVQLLLLPLLLLLLTFCMFVVHGCAALRDRCFIAWTTLVWERKILFCSFDWSQFELLTLDVCCFTFVSNSMLNFVFCWLVFFCWSHPLWWQQWNGHSIKTTLKMKCSFWQIQWRHFQLSSRHQSLVHLSRWNGENLLQFRNQSQSEKRMILRLFWLSEC